MGQVELEGMPEAATLRLVASDGQVFVACGHSLVWRYDADDKGMRNLAIVALTDAGRRVPARHENLTVTGHQPQRRRLRHALQFNLTHTKDSTTSQPISGQDRRKKSPAHRADHHLLEEV